MTRRYNPLEDPERLLRERDAAFSALAEILRLTYRDDVSDELDAAIKTAVRKGTRSRKSTVRDSGASS